jgi:hypothetical protein
VECSCARHPFGRTGCAPAGSSSRGCDDLGAEPLDGGDHLAGRMRWVTPTCSSSSTRARAFPVGPSMVPRWVDVVGLGDVTADDRVELGRGRLRKGSTIFLLYGQVPSGCGVRPQSSWTILMWFRSAIAATSYNNIASAATSAPALMIKI